MDNDTYVARGAADLLDLIPALFGFEPRESFIAIATHGERRRFGFRLRLDMPPSRHAVQAAVRIARHIDRQDADGVILIALTDQAHDGDALMAAAAAELSHLPIHEAVRSDGARYWTYGPEGPGASNTYVRRCSPVVVGAVLDGRQILPDRESLVARFAEVSGDRRVSMEQATARVLNETMHEFSAGARPGLGVAGMLRLVPIIDRHAAGGMLADDDLAMLAIWVSAEDVRNAVWSQIERTNAEVALELWTRVAQCVVGPFEAPVLCLAAFAAWLTGDGAQALIAVERALDAEPGYPMGVLISRMLDAGLSPERWDGFDPDPPSVAA